MLILNQDLWLFSYVGFDCFTYTNAGTAEFRYKKGNNITNIIILFMTKLQHSC